MPENPDLLDATANGRRLSFRAGIILGLLVVLAFGFATPVTTGLNQWQKIAALQAEIEMTETEVAELSQLRQRFDDPEYVKMRSRRDHLFVQPGQDVFIVSGLAESEPEDVESAVGVVTNQPWYVELADSLRAVGTVTGGQNEQ